MKRSELKCGDVLEDANGSLRLMVGRSAISVSDGGLSEEMIGTAEDISVGHYHIKRVYRIVHDDDLCADFDFFFGESKAILDNCELVWESSELQPRQMTKEQIEEMLGFKIKIEG